MRDIHGLGLQILCMGLFFEKLSSARRPNTLGDSIGHWAQAGADFIDENGGGPGVRL
jgi:hypothetical protein